MNVSFIEDRPQTQREVDAEDRTEPTDVIANIAALIKREKTIEVKFKN